MNAFQRSSADDSSEVTWPVDLLALAAARAQNDDETFPVDLFVDDRWDEDEPPLPAFFVVGGPPAVVRMTRGLGTVAQARGIVKRIEEDHLVLGTPGSKAREVLVGFRLPASVDVRPLIGRRVRLALEEEPRPRGVAEQTLTVRAATDGHVWLVARRAGEGEATHAVGDTKVRVTGSPNDGGALVVAAGDLRRIVPPGGDARIALGGARYVFEHTLRDPAGCAAYFLADDRLWH